MRIALVAFLLTALAGCSLSSPVLPTGWSGGTVVVGTPGKFDKLECPEMLELAKKLEKRERELSDLMARASSDQGGAFVNTVVYAPDLASTSADRGLLAEAMARNQCTEVAAGPPKQ